MEDEVKRCKLCGDIVDEKELSIDGYCTWCDKRRKAVGKIVHRASASVDMEAFDPTFYKDSQEWIEVTEWANGEGVDILIKEKDKERSISLHISEIEALISLLDRIGYDTTSYCPKDEEEDRENLC